MNYKLAIFDLDGTILDTLDDLAESLNFALKSSGFPERTIDEVRHFVGNGIRKLIERGVPDDTEIPAIDKVFEDFKKHYSIHCADKTKPYCGIPELLNDLNKEGCKTAVVSNKADFAVQELCKKYFPNVFNYAVGEREGIAKKPSPDSVNEVLKKLEINNNDAIYIGDSEVDIQTAQNADINSIIVSWGFRDVDFLEKMGAKTIVKTTNEIKKIIL